MSWFNLKDGQTLFGALFGPPKRMDFVQPGTSFRFVHEDNLVETAKVEAVAADRYGIPHVKFKVIFSRANRFIYEEGTRLLALRTFAERYKEQIPDPYPEQSPVAPA